MSKLNLQVLMLCLVTCILSSCSDDKQEQAGVTNTDEFKSYPVNIKAKVVKLPAAVKSIEIVQLQETDESLISEIILSVRHQGMYIFVANKDHDIMFFDAEGKFIRKFNRLGDGPEEYGRVLDFWVEENTINLLDTPGRTVKRYSMDGDFINSKKLSSTIGHMYPLGNQYLMQTNQHSYEDSLQYKWILTDESFTAVDTYLPFDAPSIFDASFPGNYISPYKSGLVFYSLFTDSLYYLNDNQFSPIAHIDLADGWYWNDKPNATSKDMDGIMSSDKAWDLQVYMANEHIFGRTPVGSQSWLIFLIDRETGKVTNLDMTKPSQELYAMDIEMVDSDRFLFSLSADEVSTLISEFNPSQVNYRNNTTIALIEAQENPVLIWTKFKGAE